MTAELFFGTQPAKDIPLRFKNTFIRQSTINEYFFIDNLKWCANQPIYLVWTSSESTEIDNFGSHSQETTIHWSSGVIFGDKEFITEDLDVLRVCSSTETSDWQRLVISRKRRNQKAQDLRIPIHYPPLWVSSQLPPFWRKGYDLQCQRDRRIRFNCSDIPVTNIKKWSRYPTEPISACNPNG
jgi:hypothetical protein